MSAPRLSHPTTSTRRIHDERIPLACGRVLPHRRWDSSINRRSGSPLRRICQKNSPSGMTRFFGMRPPGHFGHFCCCTGNAPAPTSLGLLAGLKPSCSAARNITSTCLFNTATHGLCTSCVVSALPAGTMTPACKCVDACRWRSAATTKPRSTQVSMVRRTLSGACRTACSHSSRCACVRSGGAPRSADPGGGGSIALSAAITRLPRCCGSPCSARSAVGCGFGPGGISPLAESQSHSAIQRISQFATSYAP